MPDRHRGNVELVFPNGIFKDFSGTEPLQLYSLCERESTPQKSSELPTFDSGFLLVFCTAGEGTVICEKGTYPIKRDTVLLCPPDTYTAQTVSSGGNQLRYVCIHMGLALREHESQGELSSLFMFLRENERVLSAADASEVYATLSSLIAELSLPQNSQMLIKGYLYQILIEAYRRFVQHVPADSSGAASVNAVGHTVYAIIRYIDDHLCSMNNLMGMAKELGYSYNYLSHLFRRKTGMTIQEYVSRKKIEKSTALLSEECYSITEIASMLNYDCIQSFSKAFRRAMNMSPTEYRARHGISDDRSN